MSPDLPGAHVPNQPASIPAFWLTIKQLQAQVADLQKEIQTLQIQGTTSLAVRVDTLERLVAELTKQMPPQ